MLVRWENGNCFPYRRSKLDLAVVEPKEIGSYQSNLILPALNITSNRHTSDEDCDSSETSTRSLTRRSSRVVFDTRSTYGRSKFRHGYDSDSSASPTNYLGNKKRLVISSILWNQQLKGKQMVNIYITLITCLSPLISVHLRGTCWVRRYMDQLQVENLAPIQLWFQRNVSGRKRG